MRHLILIAAILAGPAAAATPAKMTPVIDPNAFAPSDCPPISRYDAARKGGKLGARRLGELPAADNYKAVYRRVGGCVVPVIAGFGYGLPGKVRR